RTMTREITHAKTGRSMKKRANMLASLLPCDRDGHVYQLRLDGNARSDLEQPVDDYPLTRLHAFFDYPQPVVERPQADGTGAHLILVGNDVENLLALIGINGPPGDQQVSMRLTEEQP